MLYCIDNNHTIKIIILILISRDRKGKVIKSKDYSEYTDSEEEEKENEKVEEKEVKYEGRKRVTTDKDDEEYLQSQFRDNQ
jgi:hypothetical protein